MTCGDVEANPGPHSLQDMGSPIRFRAKRARPHEETGEQLQESPPAKTPLAGMVVDDACLPAPGQSEGDPSSSAATVAAPPFHVSAVLQTLPPVPSWAGRPLLPTL